MPRKPTRFDLADYAGLIRAIRRRRLELGLTCNEVDDLAGLQTGYTAKLEMWTPQNGIVSRSHPHQKRTARTIGIVSLPLIMTALGLKLVVAEGQPPAHAKRGPQAGSA